MCLLVCSTLPPPSGIQDVQCVQHVQGVKGVQHVQRVQGVKGVQHVQCVQGVKDVQCVQGIVYASVESVAAQPSAGAH